MSVSPLQGICSDHRTTLPKVALGWMYLHSELSAEHREAVIVCGSSVGQIEANMEVSVDTKPLSKARTVVIHTSKYVPLCSVSSEGFDGDIVVCLRQKLLLELVQL